MADSKEAPPQKDLFVEAVWMLFAFLIAVSIITSIYNAIVESRIFSHGLSGLTHRGMLELNTRPISSLFNPISAKIVSLNETDVFDSPQGKKIGKHKMGDRGIILQGPVEINVEKYWYVDYEKDPDGWVRETDIAYVERETTLFQKIVMYIYDIVWYLRLAALLIFAISVVFIIYLMRKLVKIRQNEDEMLYTKIHVADVGINPKWQSILDHIETESQNDWRHAILEADIMLDDLLDKLGLPGETMGDKLKAVEKSDFTTIDSAWEAHKVRNQIAHEGGDFVLTQREARRVIDLYKKVFEEFEII